MYTLEKSLFFQIEYYLQNASATSETWIVSSGVTGVTCKNTKKCLNYGSDMSIDYILLWGTNIIVGFLVFNAVSTRCCKVPSAMNSGLARSNPISSLHSRITVSRWFLSLGSFLPPGKAICPDQLFLKNISQRFSRGRAFCFTCLLDVKHVVCIIFQLHRDNHWPRVDLKSH